MTLLRGEAEGWEEEEGEALFLSTFPTDMEGGFRENEPRAMGVGAGVEVEGPGDEKEAMLRFPNKFPSPELGGNGSGT